MATPISDKIASETPYTGEVVGGAVGGVSGTSCILAAQTDALCVAGHSLGLVDPSPFPGACEALGLSYVVGVNGGEHYVVFKDGKIVGTVPGSGKTDTVALAAEYGIDTDHYGRLLRLVAEA
jgi:hypothetical protein